MIDNKKIEEIKNSIDIVDVISEYLSLKKAGRNYKALCPFHNEKTPSFIVSPEKQIFHCFGCGAGGNVFSFIQRQENLSFIESVRFLAKKSGIELEYTKDGVKLSDKEKIIEVNKEALNFFIENFKNNETVINYAKERNLTEEVIRDFKLGYAPFGNKLYAYLKSKNYQDEIIIKSGLCVKKGSQINDVFFNRLIFPIFNIYDAPIAFGARVLDNSLPKYINTRETEVYVKGRTLFNLNNAKRYSSDFIIVVEGYMDVIALYKSGIKNVVATSGTAFTEEQARLIKRFTKKVILIYDSDDAGIAGAIKGGNNLFIEGLEVFVVILEEAKDPDELIKKYGVDKIFEKIKNAVSFIDFRFDIFKRKGNINNMYYKQKVLSDISDLIKKTDNFILKDEIIKKVKDEFNISEYIIDKFLQDKDKSKELTEELKSEIISSKGVELSEKFIFEIVMTSLNTIDENVIIKHFIEKRKQMEIDYSDFKNNIYAEVLENIENLFQSNEKPILKKLELKYIENDKINQIFSEILTKDNIILNLDTKYNIINDCFIKLAKEMLKNESKNVQLKIKEAEVKKDIHILNEYIRQKQEIQRKIILIEGGKKID